MAAFIPAQVKRGALRAPCMSAFYYAQMSSREIFAPSSETPAISPALVSTNASTGLVAVVVSMFPFAPTFTSATVASPPTDQPWLLRKLSSASCVMNSRTTPFDCAPICRPNEPAAVL